MSNPELIRKLSALLKVQAGVKLPNSDMDAEALLASNKQLALQGDLRDDPSYRQHTIHHEPAWFSNEFGFSKTLSEIDSIPEKRDGKYRVAILVGESHFLSALPVLAKHADTVIFADLDASVLAQNMYQLQCFRKSDSFEEFLKYMISEDNPCSCVYGCEPETIQYRLVTSNSRLKPKDSIKNPDHFKLCKMALERIDFYAFPINLFEPTEVNDLNTAIRQSQSCVSLLNVSNIHHYDVYTNGMTATRYPANIKDRGDYRHFVRRNALNCTISMLAHEAIAILFSVADEWKNTEAYQRSAPKNEIQSLLAGFIEPELFSQHATSVTECLTRLDKEQQRINAGIRLYADALFFSRRYPDPKACPPDVEQAVRGTKDKLLKLLNHTSIPIDKGQKAGCSLPPGFYRGKDHVTRSVGADEPGNVLTHSP